MSFQYLSPPLGGFLAFFFFPQHGPQTPVFTSIQGEKKKQESEADSCLQTR